MATTTTDKAAGLPDGLHAIPAVAYLASIAGYEADKLPGVLIFGEEMGFSQVTGFIKSSNGRGFYMVTRETCTCQSFMYRGPGCKHQKRLSQILEGEPSNETVRGEVRSGAARRDAAGPWRGPAILGEEREERVKADSSHKLPAGVVPLSSDALDARRRRIEERNATRATAPKVEERPSRGFGLPPEARA